jgi:membrane protein DedA with SNARE-associated domain
MHDIGLLHWLASDNGWVVYSTVLGTLLLIGIGLPIPEDLILLLAGIAAYNKIVSVQGIFIVCYCGVLAGDIIMYFIGYFFGRKLLYAGTKARFFSALNLKRIAEIKRSLRKRRMVVVFAARHLFPIRSATFVAAGTLRIPFWEFILADGLAALLRVSVLLYLGHFLAETVSMETLEYLVSQAHFNIILAVALIAIGYFIKWRRKKAAIRTSTDT